MKLFLFLLIASCLVGGEVKGQTKFHIKATCNPSNDGKVNPMWKNNYVVEWTADNWKNFQVINDQLTWYGVRDDGSTFCTSSYEKISFQTIEEASAYAQRFVSISVVGQYEAMAYSKHLKLSEKFKKENLSHPISASPPNESQCKEKIIY